MNSYVLTELNVRKLDTATDALTYVTLKTTPNFATLGKRVGKSMKELKLAIENLSDKEIADFRENGCISILNFNLSSEDILIKYEFQDKLGPDMDAICDADGLLVILELQTDQSLEDAGLAREVVNRIQKLRKSSGLQVDDSIDVYYKILEQNDQDKIESAKRIFADDKEGYFVETLGSAPKVDTHEQLDAVVVAEEAVQLSNEIRLLLKIVKQQAKLTGSACPSFDAYLKCREYSSFKAESRTMLNVKIDDEDVSERLTKDVRF